jgi:monofunctional biosynthetic peptidoglycan transglycosylase
VAVVRFVNPSFTASMVWDAVGKRLRSEPYRPPAQHWVPIQSISPHLRRAVLAAEDQRFTRHYGFDFTEIRDALGDILAHKRVRGASTISMQTARTVYLLPARNIVRKVLEAYYTVLIELFWSKSRILEVYLNTVDWGSGIMGADAAARKYFEVGAGDLDRIQSACLAAILPSPHRLSPTRPCRYVRARASRIMVDMGHMPLL